MPNVNFTIPSTVLVGDFMEAHIAYVTVSATSNSTPPAGWTFVRKIQINQNVTDDVYSRVAIAGDPGSAADFTVTSDVTAAAGVLMAISNTTGEDDYKALGAGATSVAATPGSLGSTPTNVTVAGELILLMMVVHGNATLTPPAGWTVIRELATTNLSLLFARQQAAAIGAAPSFTITLPSRMDSFCAEVSYQGATSVLNTFTVA